MLAIASLIVRRRDWGSPKKKIPENLQTLEILLTFVTMEVKIQCTVKDSEGKWKVFASFVINGDNLSVSKIQPSAYAKSLPFNVFIDYLASIPNDFLADLVSDDVRSKLDKNHRVGDLRLIPRKIIN